ncbi:hypothetical protein [Streptomyces sp. B6B3]|uniref:MmyB family transcriptional regulator n=1 Tax=Streptomyces sp. B6B3 TaxID=3153570 RepID=UPI00325CC0A8
MREGGSDGAGVVGGVDGEVRAAPPAPSHTGHTPPSWGTADVPNPRLLRSLLEHVSAPAYVTDAATGVLAWNALASEVFGDYAAWPLQERNLLRLLFTQPAFATRLVDRDEYAARVVHTFRQRSRAHLQDPTVVALVEELGQRSSRFRLLSESRELRRAGADAPLVDHPAGRLAFTVLMFQDVGPAGIRFNAYLPADPVSADTTRAIGAAAALNGPADRR